MIGNLNAPVGNVSGLIVLNLVHGVMVHAYLKDGDAMEWKTVLMGATKKAVLVREHIILIY